ncbi:MAG: energy-coupling factor transporter ATPase [Acutalibacteraceae bacterium]|jgi:energy-coupling factor transport system ATP-binding protein|nr:energy-coupling factor transporter ATPase [Oscillospiraceae bacterium]MEE0443513.1 energy-coupling factor transporter ATPase [Acutalibacteraceae bacterium]CDA20057.1 cobalt ABC transporter ATP-binding protein [Ruminococcus sp. CAG:488]
MSDTIIKFDNVSFAYELEDEGIVNAVNDFSLEVPEGQFLAVLGHNGCGKSTVAKLINGILVPNKGKVTVEGMDTSDEEKTVDIRKTVGMVFQNPDNQIVATIVEDDVAFGPENLGVEPSEIRKAVDSALKAVGMYEFRKREPHRLSGGQKQRVAIAGVIAMNTKCIVMDEPTAMLDPQGRKEVMDTVMKLNREFGITVILITHYMDEAVKADRVIVMDGGRIAMDGTPKEVFRNVERMKKLGLDVPQATELAYRLRKKGFKLPEDILDENECAEAILKVLEVRK